jgi:hypothetical protein
MTSPSFKPESIPAIAATNEGTQEELTKFAANQQAKQLEQIDRLASQASPVETDLVPTQEQQRESLAPQPGAVSKRQIENKRQAQREELTGLAPRLSKESNPAALEQQFEPLPSLTQQDPCQTNPSVNNASGQVNRLHKVNLPPRPVPPTRNLRGPQPKWIKQPRITVRCKIAPLNPNKMNDLLQRLNGNHVIKQLHELEQGVKAELSHRLIMHVDLHKQEIKLTNVNSHNFKHFMQLSTELGVQELDVGDMANSEEQFKLYQQATEQNIKVKGLTQAMEEKFALRHMQAMMPGFS